MPVEQSFVCPVLVGRAAPRASFGARLLDARQGNGLTVLVSGEAGIGKSSLLRAAAAEAREAGFLVLQSASFEADRAVPFAPFLDLVRSFAIRSSPAVAEHALAPAAPELLALFPELKTIFADAVPAPPTDPEHGRRRFFHALLFALQRLARIQPLLLIFEDVHWNDDATLDLLLHLAHGCSDHPMVLALSYRTDEVNPKLERLLSVLDRGRVATELALGRLQQGEIVTMLDAIFGAEAAPEEAFAGVLHTLTDGNPFFVEELLKTLVASGDLAPGADGRWRGRRLDSVPVPRTAVDAVRRQLSLLSAQAQELASVAAVVGRRFDFALLQVLSRCEEATLLAALKELVDAQLVVEESAERMAFRHALTREAIYMELLARQRVALHRSVADAIERLNASAPETSAEMLAYHLFEAGEWARARRYATRAAEHAFALHAPREARFQLDQAVAAAEHEGVLPDDALLLARARALETLGEFNAAHADFSAVLESALADGRRESAWEALHGLGMLWAARDYARAGEYRRRALALAREVGATRSIARSLNRVGNWHVNLEQPAPARRLHEEALVLMESLGDQRGVAETVDLLAMATHIAGDEVAAAAGCERSVALLTALGDRRGIAVAQALLAISGPSHHSSATRFGVSARTAEVLQGEGPVRITQEIGWRAGEAFCRFLLADCLLWRGEYDRGLPLVRGALAIAEELNHLEWQAGAARVLGVTALDLGADAQALEHLERAHAIAHRLGSRTWARWTAAPLAIARARCGAIPAALAVLEAADGAPGTGRDGVVPGSGDLPTLGERQLSLARAEIHFLAEDAAGALSLVETLLSLERQQEPEGAPGSPAAVGPLPAWVVAAHDGAIARPALPRHNFLRGQALLALGRTEEAVTALRHATSEAAAAEAAPLLWRTHAALGHAHRRLRRRLEARLAFTEARRIAEDLARRIPDAAMRDVFVHRIAETVPAPSAGSQRQAAKAAFGGLTARQRDVARLVAEGKTNREIARELGIAERTAEDHVADALATLGFSSRTQLAGWAVRVGLASSR